MLADIGIAPERYEAALRHLFDRPSDDDRWNDDLPAPAASPLEWTRLQAALYANAAIDLQAFSDDQVGRGLRHLMDNGESDVPFAALHETVPHDDAMRMMRALPRLCRDCIGPRLAHVQARIGSSSDPLAATCYMWFDVWPTFRLAHRLPGWREAQWRVFEDMLHVPCREVRIAALHGIGHAVPYLDMQREIDCAIKAFIADLRGGDAELADYAEAARLGRVQ